MGIPIGYTEVKFPVTFLKLLYFLGFIRNLPFSLFRFLGFSEIPEIFNLPWLVNLTRISAPPSTVSAVMIRELLPIISIEELDRISGEPPESCAVCLNDFEVGGEIRLLRNCKHIFHRTCLDRWIDHDKDTCPLCRTLFVPDEMKVEFKLC